MQGFGTPSAMTKCSGCLGPVPVADLQSHDAVCALAR
eukprot:gene12072-10416_t